MFRGKTLNCDHIWSGKHDDVIRVIFSECEKLCSESQTTFSQAETYSSWHWSLCVYIQCLLDVFIKKTDFIITFTPKLLEKVWLEKITGGAFRPCFSWKFPLFAVSSSLKSVGWPVVFVFCAHHCEAYKWHVTFACFLVYWLCFWHYF